MIEVATWNYKVYDVFLWSLKAINRLYIAVFSDVMSCSLIGIYPEDGDSKFVRNIGTRVLNTCKKTVKLVSGHVCHSQELRRFGMWRDVWWMVPDVSEQRSAFTWDALYSVVLKFVASYHKTSFLLPSSCRASDSRRLPQALSSWAGAQPDVRTYWHVFCTGVKPGLSFWGKRDWECLSTGCWGEC